jgi:hypothetical protein
MGQVNGDILVLAIFVAALMILSYQRELMDALTEEIKNLWGGPPTPMHPSPSDDGALLRRRARRSEH